MMFSQPHGGCIWIGSWSPLERNTHRADADQFGPKPVARRN
jgi:hypothetical protein